MIDRLTLAAWVAGALDPARAAEVDEAVAGNSGLLAQAAALRDAAAAPWPADDGWRLPLPQGGKRMAVMGGAGPGDPVVLPVPAGEGQVMVLHRGAFDWEQVLPGPGEPPIDTNKLRRREVLVVPDTVGTHDWTVIVAPPDVGDLQAAVARGDVPIVRVRVEVG
jgi:hypothetical protein